MKTARMQCSTLRRTTGILSLAATLSLVAFASGCDDENDPKTWVKRLDDQAQRATAIKRLGQFYEDGVTRAGNNRQAPAVGQLLDTILDPLTKQYTAGGLDDKTRIDLMKVLAETQDARTEPAIAKALKDFEMGKTDDEVRVSCESISSMAKAGVKIDSSVADELWSVFSRFRLSKTNSQRLYQALHDAVLSVKDPSYCDKAIDKLKSDVPSPTPETVELVKDQIQWWQLTSVQVISELHCNKAVPQLVAVLLTPTKIDLNATVKSALLKMPKDAEQELLKAFAGQGSYAKAGDAYTDKKHLAILADALGFISRPGGRDAILGALPSADTDTTRTAFAQSLVQFPKDPRSEPAFQAADKKESWTATLDFLGALNPRSALAQVAAQFYDPSLVDWLLKEAATAPDDESKLLPWEAAVKLMGPDKKAEVLATLKRAGLRPEYSQPAQQMFDYAAQAVDKCGTGARCYVNLLDDPIPSTPKTANFRAVKAAWMAACYGDKDVDATRGELVKRVDKTKNAAARLAVVEAIDALAPKGDNAAADALEKIVAADKGGDQEVRMADDSVAKIAMRLRARAVP